MLTPGKLYKNTKPDNYWVFGKDVFLYLGIGSSRNETEYRFFRGKEEISFDNDMEFIEL